MQNIKVIQLLKSKRPPIWRIGDSKLIENCNFWITKLVKVDFFSSSDRLKLEIMLFKWGLFRFSSLYYYTDILWGRNIHNKPIWQKPQIECLQLFSDSLRNKLQSRFITPLIYTWKIQNYKTHLWNLYIHYDYVDTVWKFKNFSANPILREIKFGTGDFRL